METINIETTVAYPARWRVAGNERMIVFTIPTHSDLLPHLAASPPKTVSCYYRNLRFKYGTLTSGTPIRITADVDFGTRGGIQLHIRELELIGPTAQDLTKVDSKMIKKWTKQFEKQHSIPGL